MTLSDLQTQLADQLYTWTDNHALQPAQSDFCCLAPAPPPAPAPDAAARSFAPWFPHRALQTLWQTGLQMRPRPRPWPKVLPLGQSLRATAANGLRSTGLSPRNHRISSQLSTTPSDFGRDLCHQSRVVVPSRRILRNCYESCPARSVASLRCRTWQSARRQHALRLARQRSSRKRHGGRA
jgi:hypothetical protein